MKDILEALDYEIRASWWAGWLPGKYFNSLSAKYFAWKVSRKWRRYIAAVELRNKMTTVLDKTHPSTQVCRCCPGDCDCVTN